MLQKVIKLVILHARWYFVDRFSLYSVMRFETTFCIDFNCTWLMFRRNTFVQHTNLILQNVKIFPHCFIKVVFICIVNCIQFKSFVFNVIHLHVAITLYNKSELNVCIQIFFVWLTENVSTWRREDLFEKSESWKQVFLQFYWHALCFVSTKYQVHKTGRMKNVVTNRNAEDCKYFSFMNIKRFTVGP